MNSASYTDSNIPVLTEVISVEDAALPVPQAVPASALAPHTEEQAPAISEEALEQLEKTLRENVLRQLMGRVDFVLEHRVRDSLADVLQTAVDGLTQEIRAGLSNSLEDVIKRAISQEMAKIQAQNSKNQGI